MRRSNKNEDIVRSKVFTLEHLVQQVHIWRLKSKKIVFTNGCYDLIHPGHIHFLSEAKDHGDILIVGVNTDESVRRLGKGPSRPIQDENARALVMASLQMVNAVVLFSEETPLELITMLIPDVLVKGGDYDAAEKNKSDKRYIVGSDFVLSKGGEVATVSIAEGFSTTSIEKKMHS